MSAYKKVEPATRPARVGIIGCGAISGIYFKNGKVFNALDIVACADQDITRAQAKAEEYSIAKALTTEDLLADSEVEIVINLTIPGAHYSVCKAALEAGKHVYVEKPLSVAFEEGRELVELARAKNLRVGNAPDTFLGGGIQTAIKLLRDGWIGEPVGAFASMMSSGVEAWHPNPIFYYEKGGGPMFDMGPYYLTALVALLGPMTRVTGSTRITYPTRYVTSAPFAGNSVEVETPTHITGIMDFASGAIGTITTSFDVRASKLPRIEIYGTEGTLGVPDPNTFGGPVMIKRKGASEWSEIALTHGHSDNGRGVGVADMAAAVQSGRAHRASGDLGLHVLEAMHGFHTASDTGAHYKMTTHVETPAPMPLHLSGESVEA